MNKYKRVIVGFCFFIFLILGQACQDNSDASSEEKADSVAFVTSATHSEQPQDTSEKKNAGDTVSENMSNNVPKTKYICPLGDKEGNVNKGGNCAACGMELIENPDL